MNTAIKAAAAAAAIAATMTGCTFANQQWRNNCRVTSKDVLYSVVDGASNRTQRVSTTCGAFDVTSSLAGGFNSWDNWEALQVDKVYDIRTGGFRIGIMSNFPTVLEVRAK